MQAFLYIARNQYTPQLYRPRISLVRHPLPPYTPRSIPSPLSHHMAELRHSQQKPRAPAPVLRLAADHPGRQASQSRPQPTDSRCLRPAARSTLKTSFGCLCPSRAVSAEGRPCQGIGCYQPPWKQRTRSCVGLCRCCHRCGRLALGVCACMLGSRRAIRCRRAPAAHTPPCYPCARTRRIPPLVRGGAGPAAACTNAD